MKKRRLIIYIVLIIVLGVFLFWYFKFAGHHMEYKPNLVSEDYWGVTFSKKYATELGVDWREAYIAVLDDLKIKQIRLPVYWDDIEPLQGVFEYEDYDWMLQEGTTRDVDFILNVGRRLPRWPECHQPVWTNGLDEAVIDAEHLEATVNTIRHFKKYSAIKYWQLENEYFFPWFGECPKANLDLIQKEIAHLRIEDERPLILTDSGELNSWRKAAKNSDILGTTMYRTVWNNYFGYFRAAWPAWFYKMKATLANKTQKEMIVAELQAEPWPAAFQKVQTVHRDEWQKTFNLKQFETNAELARRTGFTQTYFWGVEWWYWLKMHGDDSMWEKGKEIIHATK